MGLLLNGLFKDGWVNTVYAVTLGVEFGENGLCFQWSAILQKLN
jgi:hypothetical protein